MNLPKHKYLLTYRYSEIVHDLTVKFTKKFVLGYLSNLSNLSKERKPDFRTADQMHQAARSGKQNIVEAVGQSVTSKKGEIKLLGVAKASIEELIMDFEDFLRQQNLNIWPKTDNRIGEFRQFGFKLSHLSNLSGLGNLIEKPSLPQDPEKAANLILTFSHQLTFLLDRQIKAMIEKFATDGGFTENLFKKRLSLKSPK